MASLEPQIAQAQRAWEKSLSSGANFDWAPSRAVAVDLSLDGSLEGLITRDPPRSEKYLYLMENGPVQQEVAFSGLAQWKDDAGEYAAGPRWTVGVFDGKRYVEVGNVGNFGFYDSFTLSAWINPGAGTGTILSRALDEPEGKGFGLFLKDGHLAANLIQRWLDDGVRLESEATVPLNRWSHVILTYDGSRLASGVQLYLNGRPLKTKVDLDYLNQPFDVKQPLRIGAGFGPANRFQGRISRVRVYRSAMTAEEAAVLAVAESIKHLASSSSDRRTPAQSAKLRWCFLDQLRAEGDAHGLERGVRPARTARPAHRHVPHRDGDAG